MLLPATLARYPLQAAFLACLFVAKALLRSGEGAMKHACVPFPMAVPAVPDAPLKVAVLIDHRPNHTDEMREFVGTWEQLSQVAYGHPELDLTVFFLGETSQVLPQAANVRHVLVAPCLGTEHFKCLRSIPTHT